MKEFEYQLTEVLKKGLRKFKTNPRNEQSLLECRNLMPMEESVEIHEQLTSLNSTGTTWDGLGKIAAATTTRSITINVNDYVTGVDLATVAVYLDNVSKGNTNASGNITIADVETGGHTLKLTKTGYTDSDDDDLYNDYIVVT